MASSAPRLINLAPIPRVSDVPRKLPGTEWRRLYAFLPVRIGTNEAGDAEKIWGQFFEERWMGDGHTGVSHMQRRRIGDVAVYDFWLDMQGRESASEVRFERFTRESRQS